MRRFFLFVGFAISLAAGSWFVSSSRLRDVFHNICSLTDAHFYRDDSKLRHWVRECHQRANRFSRFGRVGDLMKVVQEQLDKLEISHFAIFSPSEDRSLWKGQVIDTGIRSRYVEDHLVVSKVLKGSSADLAGVRPGDDILSIPGSEQITPWGAEHRSGRFVFRRGGKTLEIVVKAQEFTLDLSPKLTELDSKSAWLELPSFRSEFFNQLAWRREASAIKKYSHVIIDLRENNGGNFVAMLRALSTFYCERRVYIGDLVQPRNSIQKQDFFVDETDDRRQIFELSQAANLGLRTFGDYGCFQGRVTALVGPNTSSVAEIFAYGLRYRTATRVWGQPTAGDVVLAVWYDLPELGPEYSLSIPEAIYMTPEKHTLEGNGVWPDRELYDVLEQALRGEDTWILEALKH